MGHRINKNIFLAYLKRTAIGSFQGALSTIPAPELAAHLIKDGVQSLNLEAEKIDWVMLGCVLQAGIGQAPARQAAIFAQLPVTVQAATINKVCSSGLFSIMQAALMIESGCANCIVAGGMENMSQAPYYLPSLRAGARLGHTKALDAIIADGLWDVYNNQHMGNCAELLVKEYGFTREEQDAFALQSYRKAKNAIEQGLFKDEIVEITVKTKREEIKVDTDEEPNKLKEDKVPTLKPAFDKEGTVTAANASSINDGAAVAIVCSEEFVKNNNLSPIARIEAISWAGQKPEWFTTAPVAATQDLLQTLNCSVDDIDLFEVNEAFAAVALAYQKELSLPDQKVNINGGAVALGHPIGASGARILVTLVNALKQKGLKKGIAAICNGGGEATAMAVEMV